MVSARVQRDRMRRGRKRNGLRKAYQFQNQISLKGDAQLIFATPLRRLGKETEFVVVPGRVGKCRSDRFIARDRGQTGNPGQHRQQTGGRDPLPFVAGLALDRQIHRIEPARRAVAVGGHGQHA